MRPPSTWPAWPQAPSARCAEYDRSPGRALCAEEHQRAMLVPTLKGKRKLKGRVVTASEIMALMWICANDPCPWARVMLQFSLDYVGQDCADRSLLHSMCVTINVRPARCWCDVGKATRIGESGHPPARELPTRRGSPYATTHGALFHQGSHVLSHLPSGGQPRQLHTLPPRNRREADAHTPPAGR